MATIYEVSERSGVSLATVSRVLNGTAKVSAATKQKVLDAMRELNYRPNSAAQSLASNCSNSIGMLVSELHGPFFGAMMSEVESVLRAAGKHLIIAAGHSKEDSERDSIEFLRGKGCDGFIFHVDAVKDEYLQQLLEEGVKFVVLNRRIESMASNCISLDNQYGGYIGTKGLLDAGHRQVAYVAGPQWKADAHERLEGYKRAMTEYGCNIDPRLIVEGDFSSQSGNKAMTHLLSQRIPFTAVACGNDEMAYGVMNCLRAHKLKVPEDISVMGFDNNIMSSYTFPRLTTVNYPVGEIGHMAAKWMLKNLYGQSEHELKYAFKPRLIHRDSVRPYTG